MIDGVEVGVRAVYYGFQAKMIGSGKGTTTDELR